MYFVHNEGISVIVERFIRTLKNKIYKHKGYENLFNSWIG